MGVKRSDHATPILKNLHWLPVEKKIEFKILLITYKTIHGHSADYLKPLIEMYQPSRTLRSASRSLLCPQKLKLKTTGVELFLLWHRNCGTPYRRTLRIPRLESVLKTSWKLIFLGRLFYYYYFSKHYGELI